MDFSAAAWLLTAGRVRRYVKGLASCQGRPSAERRVADEDGREGVTQAAHSAPVREASGVSAHNDRGTDDAISQWHTQRHTEGTIASLLPPA